MISPWTWLFATLLGVLVAMGLAAALNEAKRHYASPAFSWRHTSAARNAHLLGHSVLILAA